MSKEAMKLARENFATAKELCDKHSKLDRRIVYGNALITHFDAVCQALAEQPAQPSKPWVGLTEDEINKLMTDAARYRKLAAMERELVEPITIWHYLRNPYDLDNARAIGVAHCIKENT